MLAITPARMQRRRQVLAFPSGRLLLGAVPPDSAFVEQVFPKSSVSGRAGYTQAIYDGYLRDVGNGYILSYSGSNPMDCAKAGNASSIKGSLTKMGSGIALKLVTGGTVAGPAAPFVIAAGAILGLFSAIFNHHAMAVAREQGTLCAAVPAFNAAVMAVSKAAQDGTITPSVASASVQNILQDFLSAITPIMKECNAACVIARDARAIASKYVAIFSEMEAKSAPGAAAAAAPGAASFGSILPWAAAAGLLLYAVAK